ncbi:molybdopterin converting factor subunit 1 [Deinococcus hopiensis]|uniref:Molybdopterin synthase subunit MoaE /molybdopterin synthase subunit MoaD n=1 Tax=Deinococcus hopiensis KR-140 TaxID=695939 RepID=A0A1W1V8H5_9DEIO|nr:molybdopterin converting factor subunit 1 [Deinococcus hopiensis]SMB89652.1 molybdopterin synthase subunit MoaE /molybdopterin synthase subunit MoaD [Deinococcus hopiensis KR-140]
MQVRVMFFARLKREAGLETALVEIPDGATVRALAQQAEANFGLTLQGCMAAVNETFASPEQLLSSGDEVAFLPPVAGGTEEGSEVCCEVVSSPLRLAEAEPFLVRPAYGAQAYFVGTVRSPNKGKDVRHIDYEAFVPMAEKVMREAAAQAQAQHGQGRILIQHRVGRLLPGEASILIGVASPHRRAALEACDFLIEHLKLRLPVWKLEADEDGEHWVKGQTSSPSL